MSTNDKPTLFYIPIEPLKERYTESWYRNFPPLFRDAGFEVVVIDGQPLESEVKVGTFLDINSTTHYKWHQLQKISRLFYNRLVKDKDVFFFGDLEFWGLEGVRLLAQINKVDIRIAAFLHAASYTMEDAFSIAAPYQAWTEVGWVAACDKVFVGSEYHKWAVIDRRLRPLNAKSEEHKLVVTKNPLFLGDYAGHDALPKYRSKRLVLSNRLDVEKRPMQTLLMFEELKKRYPHWTFVLTSGRSTLKGTDNEAVSFAKTLQQQGVLEIKAGISKAEYHAELATSMFMVTHSIEENYGYCIAEAMLYGCTPFMRQGLSHREFVDDSRLFFSTQEEAVSKMASLMFDIDIGNRDLPDVHSIIDTKGAERIVQELWALHQQ